MKKPTSFGRRDNLHTITITKGGKSQKFTLRPAYFAAICGLLAIFVISYLGATAYLVMRDDLIGASLARQARIQHEYEERIATLRSRLDLVTSRQLLEQQAVETRVQELVNRQSALGSRSNIYGDVLKRAAVSGVAPIEVTIPKTRPTGASSKQPDRGITTGSVLRTKKLRLGALSGTKSPFTNSILDLGAPSTQGSASSFAYLRDTNGVFTSVENSLREVEVQQISTLKELRSKAIGKTREIAGILQNIGISLPSSTTKNIGGPLIELGKPGEFDTNITALDKALSNLNKARQTVSRLPVGSPVPGQTRTSGFGRRIDPILHRAAMHSGLDFKAPRGFPVRATGAGKVVKAGYQGGYGRMVEIFHGNGLTTRYAHMSRVSVKIGQKIRSGAIVGKVGSTGRSTGPHLHYEVRHGGKAQNPARYVRAGARLKSLL